MTTTRRDMLRLTASAAAVGAMGSLIGGTAALAADKWAAPGLMGLAGAGTPRRPAQPGQPANNDPVAAIDYAHSLGAAGLELRIKDEDIPRARKRLDELGMFAHIGETPLPTASGDTSGFEQACKQAQALGGNLIRAAMGGRRYEDFNTMAEFVAFHEARDKMVHQLAPIADKYKVTMAIENHKDRTDQQLAALLKSISSEYVGALVDFGNSISLCALPDETIATLAPYVKSCHAKDMAVKFYEDGFLLSEVEMGTGILDLKGTVAKLRKVNPNLRLVQETIIRDPLKIPINTDKYWATFPERKAAFLPKIKAFVAAHEAKTPLPHMTGLTPQQQFETYEHAVKAGFDWVKANIR